MGGQTNEGVLRGPRGPKNLEVTDRDTAQMRPSRPVVSLVSRSSPVLKWGRHVLLCAGQVCILGITLGQLIRVGSSFGRISQSCLFDPVFVLFYFTFLLKWALGTGGLDEDWSGEVEWCSGNIRNIWATSEYQEYRNDIGHNAIIGWSHAQMISGGLMMMSKMRTWLQYAAMTALVK